MSIFFQNPLDVKGKPRALALTRAKGSAGVVAVAQSGSTVALFTLVRPQRVA